MTALWTGMGKLDIEVPHERMRARFHAALAAYEERGGAFERITEAWWPARPVLGAALGASLLVAGVLIGRGLPSSTGGDIAALRSDVRMLGLALLDHQSASERLLGVAWARRSESEPQVVDALLERVQYDPSLNVRLAAAEALRARADPEVGAGLAAALERQDSPLMQVTLAEALLENGRADGVAAVRRLLDREGSIRRCATTCAPLCNRPAPPARRAPMFEETHDVDNDSAVQGRARRVALALRRRRRAREVTGTRMLQESVRVPGAGAPVVIVKNVFGSIRVTTHDRDTVDMTATETVHGDLQADIARARAEVELRTESEEGRVAFRVRRIGDNRDFGTIGRQPLGRLPRRIRHRGPCPARRGGRAVDGEQRRDRRRRGSR